MTKHFTFKSLKNIVFRQPNKIKNLTATIHDDSHTLTREEKEKILNVFKMVDSTVLPNNHLIKGSTLLRAKSPYRMEKIIEQNK